MKPIPKHRQLAELVSARVKIPSTGAASPTARLNRDNPAAQQRMKAMQPAESGANHARHHASRKAQS